MKRALGFLIILLVLSFTSGLLLYVIYKNFIASPIDSLDFINCQGYAFGFLFVTYVIYLIANNFLLKSRFERLHVAGLFCFATEAMLWLIPSLLLAGFDLRGIILNFLTVGVASYSIPYMDAFFAKRIEVDA